MKKRVGIAVATAAMCMASTMGVASAEEGGFDAQTFRPALGPGGHIITVEGADTASYLQPYGGIWFDVMSDPLKVSFEDGESESIIDRRLQGQAIFGMGLHERLNVEIGLPVVMSHRGSFMDVETEGTGLGDVFARGKWSLSSSQDDLLGLALMLDATVPTGDDEEFRGARTPTVTPALIADTRFETPVGSILVATNVGARLSGSGGFETLEGVGSAMTYGAGARMEAVPELLDLNVEFAGEAGLRSPQREKNPLEVLFGTDVHAGGGVSVSAGVGGGVVSGVGNPSWRVFGGLSWSRPVEHTEEAEVQLEERRHHECPPEPEGFSGPYDDHGCAVTPETFEGCDGLDEDWEGEVDKWGCPMLDSDGDGFLVWEDECPTEPIVFIGKSNDDGCPDHDVDGDGVPNTEDHCPLEAGLEAYDGCLPPEYEERVTRVDDQIEINERVNFETDRAVISEESYELLEQVALVIREHPDIVLVEVAGHTDDRGDRDYNMMLSQERAEAVRQFLVDRGDVNPARIRAEGYGPDEPLIDEDSDEARAENRRVEFHIVEVDEDS